MKFEVELVELPADNTLQSQRHEALKLANAIIVCLDAKDDAQSKIKFNA